MKRITVILILALLTFGVGSVTGSSGSQSNNCQNLPSQIAALKAERADLQSQLQDAPPNQKAGLAAKIKSITAQITKLQGQLQACQCPLTPPATANLLQLTGTGQLISATPHGGESFSVNLRLKNPTNAPVTIKRAERFYTDMGGWAAYTEGDLIAKTGTFMGFNPVLPAGADLSTTDSGTLSMPIAYAIFVIEAESNGNKQELITSIPVNSPKFQSIQPFSAQRRVFIGLQGPVESLKLTNGKNWLSVIGHVINGTGKAAAVKDWKLSLRDSLGNLVVTASDQRFFDGKDNPAPFNGAAALNKFLYGFELPSSFTKGTLSIDANVTMEGICQHITSTADVRAALTFTVASPVGGLWKWGNGPGASGFHAHNNGVEGRYAYDLGITKTVNGKQQTFDGDKAVNESYFCWNQPIFCVEDGVVEAVNDTIDDNLGNQGINPKNINKDNAYVVVKHGDNRYSEYVHVRKGSALVKPGQKVFAGTMLARVGNAGQSSEPHLHFGYYVVDRGRLRGLSLQFSDLLNLNFSKAIGVPVDGVSYLSRKLL